MIGDLTLVMIVAFARFKARTKDNPRMIAVVPMATPPFPPVTLTQAPVMFGIPTDELPKQA
jgi:hypothetical protein